MTDPEVEVACKQVCLLTGFLGSGKTTLLRSLLQAPDSKKWALVVNDVAALNIDAALVTGEDRAGEVLRLQNGCICCTLREDLVSTVKKLALKDEFNLVIVEASGMAEPQPIHLAFDDSSLSLMIITVVDAATFLRDIAAGAEARVSCDHRLRDEGASAADTRGIAQLLANQTEGADVIVVNKIDRVEAITQQETVQAVRTLNPDAVIRETSFGQGVDLAQLFAVHLAGSKRVPKRETVAATPMMGALQSFVWTCERPFAAAKLHTLVQNFRTEAILRSKGFLTYEPPGGGKVVVQAYWSHAGGTLRLETMPHVAFATNSGPAHLTEIVFIGLHALQHFAAIDRRLRDCLAGDTPSEGIDDPIRLLPPSWTELGAAQTKARSSWWRVALGLAIGTVMWNLGEGVISVHFGMEEESLALVGFGADAFVEVLSALLVVLRLVRDLRVGAGGEGATEASRKRRLRTERWTAGGVGGLLLCLGTVAITSGVVRLLQSTRPISSLAGIIISLVSLSFMFILWFEKMRASQALGSATLACDAACCLDCIKLSFVLLLGSAVYAIEPLLWWIDSAAALVIGALIAKEGFVITRSSCQAEFDGSAHCCAPDSWTVRVFGRLETLLGLSRLSAAGIDVNAEVGASGSEWTWNGYAHFRGDVPLFEESPLGLDDLDKIIITVDEETCAKG